MLVSKLLRFSCVVLYEQHSTAAARETFLLFGGAGAVAKLCRVFLYDQQQLLHHSSDCLLTTYQEHLELQSSHNTPATHNSPRQSCRDDAHYYPSVLQMLPHHICATMYILQKNVRENLIFLCATTTATLLTLTDNKTRRSMKIESTLSVGEEHRTEADVHRQQWPW